MTPARMSECLAALDWNSARLAREMEYGSRTSVARMLEGSAPIPDDLARWLERAARWHAQNPPPRRHTDG